MIVKLTGRKYKDGGTFEVQDVNDGKKYFVDRRIHSKTKEKLYDKYPEDKGAKIVNINFTIIK